MTMLDILGRLGVEVRESGHKHCRPGWIQLQCPWCRTNTFHLGYNLENGYFHCWKCRGHHPAAVLMALGLDRREAMRMLGGLDRGTRLPEAAPLRGTLKEPAGVGPLLPIHRDYLRGRGFDPEALQRVWELGGIGLHPRLSWRLYAPVVSGGRRVSWTTRSVGDSSQRYLSASAEEEALNHKHVVYGEDFCRGVVVIVEGPADAWAVGPGAGALFGTAFTVPQVRRLARFPSRFVCFDSSVDAQTAARELVHALAPFPGVTHNVTLDAKDPGEASPRELNLLRRATGLA